MLLAVDIGGTKIQVAHVRFDNDEPVVVRTRRTDTALLRRGSSHFVDDLVRLISGFVPDGLAGIGLTLNGVLAGQAVVYSSLMGGAIDLDLGERLRTEFHVDSFVDDDLHAMAVAEGRLGAGVDGEPCTILNLGTGVGAVAYEDGNPVRGRFGAGLISEVPFWVARLGEWRVLDRIICGRGLRELYFTFTGKDVDARNVYARYLDHEPHAVEVFNIFIECLVWAVGLIARFYHPAHILLHGSVAGVWHTVRERVMSGVDDMVEYDFRPLTVGLSELTHSAELGVVVGGWRTGEVYRHQRSDWQ